MRGFADWYNYQHKHRGIKYVTPDQRHNDQDVEILARRHAVYQEARERSPQRWERRHARLVSSGRRLAESIEGYAAGKSGRVNMKKATSFLTTAARRMPVSTGPSSP